MLCVVDRECAIRAGEGVQLYHIDEHRWTVVCWCLTRRGVVFDDVTDELDELLAAKGFGQIMNGAEMEDLIELWGGERGHDDRGNHSPPADRLRDQIEP